MAVRGVSGGDSGVRWLRFGPGSAVSLGRVVSPEEDGLRIRLLSLGGLCITGSFLVLTDGLLGRQRGRGARKVVLLARSLGSDSILGKSEKRFRKPPLCSTWDGGGGGRDPEDFENEARSWQRFGEEEYDWW